MKILFINTVYGRGSTGRIVKELGEAVEKNGGEYKVIYGRGKTNDSHAIRFTNEFEILIHVLKARIFDRAGFYSTYSTKRMIKYIKKYNPDIIHLHNLHGYYLNVEILFNYLKTEYKGKVVWTLHDCWAFTGHCVHYTQVGCSKWIDGCNECCQKKVYPKSSFFDRSKRNYKEKKELFTGIDKMTIVTVSKWLGSQVSRSFLKDYSIKTIYNGVDYNKFHYVKNDVKKELGIDAKKMILLVSDGWNEQKGYYKVIEIAKQAPKEWQFVMIGVSSKEIAELPHNITGIERVWNQEKLNEFYSATDVFYNPSIEETFGLVTAEAMACGTPVVVMNSTASPEMVTSSDLGSVLEVDASIEEVISILSENIEKKTNKENEKIFSIEKFCKNYINVYLEKE